MTLTDRKPVIVSLTPLALSADSRTLKQATSVHRFGFKSIVIEGQPSRFAREAIPFEVITLGDCANSQPQAAEAAQTEANEEQSKANEGKSVLNASRVNVAGDVQSCSLLRRSSFGQSVLRYIPAFRPVARALQRSLYRAIVSRRGIRQAPEQPSTKEIVLAIPYAMLLLTGEIASGLRSGGMNGTFRAALVNPLAFARHLTTYLNQYFFQVLFATPRADIYYLHAFYQFPAVFILCLRYRAKMIYDAHDFYLHLRDDPSLSSYWKNWVIPFERVVEWACVRFADDVVTVNDGIAALMRKEFRCEPVTLRNAHDFRLDSPSAGAIRQAIGLPPDAFLVVSIGNCKPGTALEPMLDALSALPRHVHVAFLGGGYPSFDGSLASRGIEGRVHPVGRVLPQEVVPFAASADAAILLYYGRTANYPNALPNGFFQSIAAELPLVYPNLDQIRRVAEHYDLGIMANPQEPSEIKAALQVLIEDDERRIAIRENLRRIRRELCWEHEEQVLKRLLNRHLGKSAQGVSRVEDKVAH